MAYFKADDDCSLSYETMGFQRSTDVVIFLNGTLQTTLYWKALAGKLKNRCRVITYDARAQGASDLGTSPLSIERHVMDLMGLMDHLGVERAHLVGFSHGAYVALCFAAAHSRRVASLMLCSVGSAATYRGRLIVRSWLETLRYGGLMAMVWATLPHVFGERYLRQNEKILDHIVQSVVRRNRQEAVLAHLEALQHYEPIQRRLKPLPCPVQVLTGGQDPLVTTADARHIAQCCGGSHRLIEAAGHSLAVEAPEAFLAALKAFLNIA